MITPTQIQNCLDKLGVAVKKEVIKGRMSGQTGKRVYTLASEQFEKKIGKEIEIAAQRWAERACRREEEDTMEEMRRLSDE